MNGQENTKIIQLAYENFKKGNIQAVLDLLSDTVEWRYPGGENIPQAGLYQGHQGVAQFFATIAQTQDVLQFEPEEFIAEGDRVVALGNYVWHVRSTRRGFASDFVHVFTVRDGKITSFQEYTDTATVAAAFEE